MWENADSLINGHFHESMRTDRIELANLTIPRQILTLLTVFSRKAVHTLTMLPRPVVQTGAPVSAGTGSAGSFQSWASIDTQPYRNPDNQKGTLTTQPHSKKPGGLLE